MLVTTLMRYWHITNGPMGAGPITIDISGSNVSIQGLPEGMAFHQGYLPWVGDLMEQDRPRTEK